MISLGIDYTRAKNIAKHLENNNYVQKLVNKYTKQTHTGIHKHIQLNFVTKPYIYVYVYMYITWQYMSWNGLEDHGCKYVARMLEHNFCLRFLDLSSNSKFFFSMFYVLLFLFLSWLI